MDLEQIIKRLEWLDDEHRRDKTAIATLEKRIAEMEGGLPALSQGIKQVSGEISRLAASLSRLDSLEGNLVQIRVDANRNLEAIERLRSEHERETEKVRRVEIDALTKSINEVRKGLDPIPELKKAVQARLEEDYRLTRLIEETGVKVVENRRNDDEYKRMLRLLEEGQRTENKRLNDLLGEVSALRKRTEEQRGKVDLTSDQLRKLETRMSELAVAENERRAAQATFLEKQTLIQAERERAWKDWLVRFEAVEKRASGLDTQLQSLDATHRAVKHSQDALDEVTNRIERRINEITEMQRLSEDRFRQDWTSFKADDQKRWTNYSIAHEEQGRDVGRQFEKIIGRFAGLEDATQELQDAIVLINEETEKRLQALLTLAHEWMATYEKTFNHSS
ncbi:MAG: hypothetical protein PHQ40_13330 [Anaerolineaceae bacterium]|nr:hypothetical protein [Anaerolineaceae bacterium]